MSFARAARSHARTSSSFARTWIRASVYSRFASLTLSLLLAAGCGRIGLELEPRDTGTDDEEDATPEDSGPSDAGEEMDAEPSDADTREVDGCVVSEAGTCATCDVDAYVPTVSCGTGYCKATNTCVAGLELACVPGTPRADSDVTCDAIDDDCDGKTDEEYAGGTSSCGSGVCERDGTLMCMAGRLVDGCTAGAPASSLDDATGTGNGLDDDCDGRIDEDVSLCDTTPRTFEVGVHTTIAVPTGCGSVTIQLWGGAGAAGGQAGYSDIKPGGHGGSGGYARSTFALTGPLALYVGSGGAAGCDAAGTNPGSAMYSGGRGGDLGGAAGADGMIAGGGAGATNSLGADGGRGYFGGGGGGESWADVVNNIFSAHGGGGGAASAVLMNGMRVMVAGGGGGGGGAGRLVYAFGEKGGDGGEGCSGAGNAGASPRTGGGGGGGVCMAMTFSMGTNGVPANAGSVPAPRARGNDNNCAAGGNGYAIVTFAR